jgi:hypothetical protein
MSCVVRTNRREDLAVRGTLNSFRLLHPLFALQGILDHLPNRPRRHTCALQTLLNPVRAGKPPPNTPGPSRKPLEPSSIVSEQGVKRSRIKKLMIPMPQHPSQDARVLHGLQRAPISTPPAVDLMPSPARAEDSRKPLKCRQRPLTLPNGFKRARSLFRRARGRTPTMYLYISHSVFVSFLGGHSEHLLLISVVANPNKLNTLLLICSRKKLLVDSADCSCSGIKNPC